MTPQEEIIHLREKLMQLHRKASDMRGLQKQYFATRSKDVLNQSKAAEKDLDKFLEGLKIAPVKSMLQQSLFEEPKKKDEGWKTEGF